jgi:hypothetical protein
MQRPAPDPARRGLVAGALLWGSLPRGVRAAAPDLPLRLASSETGDMLQGAVQAVVPFAYGPAAEALSAPQVWCEILMLHLNNKACRLQQGPQGPALALAIARKHDQPADRAHALVLQWQRQERSDQRLGVRLHAAQGPFGTTDYAVLLQLAPAPGGGCTLGLEYACRFSPASRMLLRTYLATLGRDKVGFSARPGGGPQELVGGLRGVVERTVVRYYLAVEAWLQTAALPPAGRALARLEHWFDATERYPRQLHELDKASYLANKRRELGLGP